jgi:glycosyltransferase involved in cell wall biosynthesis
VPEIITHGRNGLLCPYEDVAQWARMTTDLMDDRPRLELLGRNAQADANERFHISKVAPRYLDIFKTAISRKRLPLY